MSIRTPLRSGDHTAAQTTAKRLRLIELATEAGRGPFTRQARRQLLFCAISVLLGLAEFATIVVLLVPGTALSLSIGGTIIGLLLLILIATIARRFGAGWRALANRLLGEEIPSPPALRVASGAGRRLIARLRDRPSWQAVLYVLVKAPFTALELFALSFWVGIVNMSYPFWWRLFRNHKPGVHLSPVPFVTPVGLFRVATYPGTFVAFLAGAAMVLAAPWVTGGVTAADRWLMRNLLGPGRLATRVHQLEEARTLAVDDAAATLRRIERDLHDGAQIRLTALAMTLGQVKENLADISDVSEHMDHTRSLVDAAHRNAKDALVELRRLARGIHPPVLDSGLDPALSTLAATSAVPVYLSVEAGERTSAAIESIAYFCAAELLNNVTKHSGATRAALEVMQANNRLLLRVSDDGNGGARARAGGGLAGLADRIRSVEGQLDIDSPPGGPTVVTVVLPTRGS